MELDLDQYGLEGDKATELKAAIQELVTANGNAVSAKNQQLLNEKKTLQNEFNTFKSQFEGVDIEKLQALAKQAEQSEEAKLLASGDFEAAFKLRAEAIKGAHGKELQTLQEQLQKAESTAQKYRNHVLTDAFRNAASKLNVLPEAIEDFSLRAANVFKLDANDNPVGYGVDGNPLYNASGAPLTVQEWSESLKENAPHLFPRAQGADAANGRPTNGKVNRSTMTLQQRTQFIAKYGQDEFLKLPK